MILIKTYPISCFFIIQPVVLKFHVWSIKWGIEIEVIFVDVVIEKVYDGDIKCKLFPWTLKNWII